MVLQMPRPSKHQKTGVYYFRVRVPRDLKELLGRSEVKMSLQTKDPTIAKERFAEQEKRTATEWKALRARPSPMPHRQLVALSGQFYEQIMEMVRDEPGEAEIWEGAIALGEAATRAPDKLEQWYGSIADKLLQSAGSAIDEASRQRLLSEVHNAYRQAAEQQVKRAGGDYSPDPKASRFPALTPKDAADGADVGIRELYELWKRDHLSNGASPRTPRDHLQKVNDLIRFVGHDNARRVTPQDIAKWGEHLRHERGLSAKTVNDKYLSAARAVFGAGVAKFKIERSPVERVHVKVPKANRERSPGFTDAEATKILTAALVAENDTGRTAPLNKRAYRWVPWICAYTGARAGEVTQLRGQDFVEEHGVPCIRITPEAGSVKTGQYRVVPIHPHLVELGLLELVEKSGASSLFYIPNNRDRKAGNSQAANVRGKVSEWVRQVAKVTDPRIQPNHAWRHRFKTIARDVDMAQRYMDAVQGHSDGSASADYGENSMKALYREIQKLPRYPIE